jgi:predicted permease
MNLRTTLRTLGHHRGFTAVAVVSLALAIALNTTMYSVLDAMIDPKLDVRSPEQLYNFRFFGDYHGRLPEGAVERALRDGLRGFDDVTGAWPLGRGLTLPAMEHDGRRIPVHAVTVRTNFFPMLGVHPLAGRLAPSAASAAAQPQIVLSRGTADKLFPGGASPVGQSVTIDDRAYTVIGVVERQEAVGPLDADAWAFPVTGVTRFLPITVIRLKPGVTPQSLAPQLDALAAQLAIAAGDKPNDARFLLKESIILQFHASGFHWALIGAVLAVLLVACANLANLQLARGLARSRELALRVALGASRRQVIRELMTESAVLAAAGLALGLLLTLWGVHLVTAYIPPQIADYMLAPQVSWHLVLFAALAALACLLVMGLLPALHVSRVDPDTLIKRGAGTGAHRRTRRQYGLLVAAQIGLTLPLLNGAVLVLRSAWRVASVSYYERLVTGYDYRPLVGGSIAYALDSVRATPSRALMANLESRLKALPGVVEASVDMSASPAHDAVTVDDPSGIVREVPAPMWSYGLTTPGQLRTMGYRIIAGRDFDAGAYETPAVIVDSLTAHFLWPDQDPVGRMIRFGAMRDGLPFMRVVGVYANELDVRRLEDMYPEIGHSMRGVYRVVTGADSVFPRKGQAMASVQFAVRTKGDPAPVAGAVQRVLKQEVGVRGSMAWTMADRYQVPYYKARYGFVSTIFSVFAALGIGLAALGVYGIVAYAVTQRRREFGVRLALGATGGDVLRLVLREGNAVALAGIALGLLFTKRSVFWLGAFLNGPNDAYDATLFAALSACLFAIACLAAYVPSRRAAQVDPVESLRAE